MVDIDTGVDITWLLAAASNGDQDAFERLYGATGAKLYGVVLRIVRRRTTAPPPDPQQQAQPAQQQQSAFPAPMPSGSFSR